MKDIDAEYQALKMENDAEHLKLEQLFKERTQKQQQIHQLEEEIRKVACQIQNELDFFFSSIVIKLRECGRKDT